MQLLLLAWLLSPQAGHNQLAHHVVHVMLTSYPWHLFLLHQHQIWFIACLSTICKVYSSTVAIKGLFVTFSLPWYLVLWSVNDSSSGDQAKCWLISRTNVYQPRRVLELVHFNRITGYTEGEPDIYWCLFPKTDGKFPTARRGSRQAAMQVLLATGWCFFL